MNINTLGLCKKCGKLVTGFDAVIDEIKNPKSKIAGVLIAADISAKTEKELRFSIENTGKKLNIVKIAADMASLQKVLGKKTGIIAVLDYGFFKSMTANSSDSQSV